MKLDYFRQRKRDKKERRNIVQYYQKTSKNNVFLVMQNKKIKSMKKNKKDKKQKQKQNKIRNICIGSMIVTTSLGLTGCTPIREIIDGTNNAMLYGTIPYEENNTPKNDVPKNETQQEDPSIEEKEKNKGNNQVKEEPPKFDPSKEIEVELYGVMPPDDVMIEPVALYAAYKDENVEILGPNNSENQIKENIQENNSTN